MEMRKGYPEKYRWDVVRMDKDEHVQFGDALQEIYLGMLAYQMSVSNDMALMESYDLCRQNSLKEGEAIGLKKGREEGEVIGLEKGRMEEKRSMARNLKSMGLDP